MSLIPSCLTDLIHILSRWS